MMYFRVALMVGWLASGLCFRLEAQGLNFQMRIAGLDAQRRPTLSLSGLNSGRYVLEASTNLTRWFTVTSGPATEPFTFVHNKAKEFGTIFYRGVQLPASTAVVAQVDSNLVASGLITMANGGSLVLTNESGVRYSFTVGPSNVLNTVAVRMQLVTNFTSFPYANEMRTAVLFEPSGFEFYGGGVLEITFPTNLPYLKVASFSFGRDGGGFFITPDAVSTNQVRIPVTHFSGVGTGLWAPSERTRAVTAFVENTRDRASQQLAEVLSRERELALLGEEPSADWAAELDARTEDYYQNTLKPYFAEAAKDCALAQFLTREILGIERQRALLGGEGESTTSSFLASDTLRSWSCNCMKEAIQACEEGRISDRTLVRTVLGFERQAALLGGGSTLESCGLGSFDTFLDQALNKKLPCIPEWGGVMTYADGGSRTWSCVGDSSDSTCTRTTATALNFEAEVERVELEDESFPPFFSKQTWRLKLFPQASGAFTGESLSVVKTECGATITTTHRENGATTGPLDLEVVFTFENGELTDFNISTAVSGDLKVETVEAAKGVTTPCDKGGTGSSNSHTFHGSVFLSPKPISIEEVVFAKRSPTALEGSITGIRSGLDEIKMPFSWTFSFRRNAQ